MNKHLTDQIPIAPLAVFRVLFGFILTVSIVRFALKGWIIELYVKPTYYFTFYGLDWVVPLGETGMYALFLIMGLSAAAVMLGWHYRIAAVTFFLTFTYVELIDKTNYLNHYYFVSIISFLLIWVPANRCFSLDVRRSPGLRADTVPAWTVNIFKLQLGLVYLFAGTAKLNSYWLLEAMPLRLWLPAHAHWPVVGGLLSEPLTAFIFSWAGAAYDLTVVFFLLWRRTRVAAYAAVVVFHTATALLFQIGMFPYIMILCTLIFFPASFHQTLMDRASSFWNGVALRLRSPRSQPDPGTRRESAPIPFRIGKVASMTIAGLLILHFALQILVPLRSILYPGNLFWTEEGYRFSWRVMLMEKAGYTIFHVRDPATNRTWEVTNWEYLTPLQEKMMATQPDMILQFVHFLADEYQRSGMEEIEITAEAYVTLNGRRSRLLIDPQIDLAKLEPDFKHKTWILPFSESEPAWTSIP